MISPRHLDRPLIALLAIPISLGSRPTRRCLRPEIRIDRLPVLAEREAQ